MLRHVFYEAYSCQKCKNLYIPYKDNFPCPYCGEIAKDSYNLIEEIVETMILHKETLYSFSHFLSKIVSFADRIQGVVCAILDDFEGDYGRIGNDEEKKEINFLKGMLDVMIEQEEEDKPYMEYIKGIVLECYKVYRKRIVK